MTVIGQDYFKASIYPKSAKLQMCASTALVFPFPTRIEIVSQVNVITVTTEFALIVIKLLYLYNVLYIHFSQLDLLLDHLSSLTNRLAEEFKDSDSPKHHRIQRLQQMTDFSCNHIRAYQSHLIRYFFLFYSLVIIIYAVLHSLIMAVHSS